MKPPLGGAALLALAACSSSGSLNPNQAATACVMAEACFPTEWASGFFGGTLAECATGGGLLPPEPGSLVGAEVVATGLEAPLSDIYRCLANADTCIEAEDCFGRDGTEGNCSPPASLETGSCDGQTLTGCSSDGFAFDVDCASYGETCHEDSVLLANVGLCDLGDCPARAECQGSKVEVCEGPGYFLADCSRLGLSCVLPADGGGAQCWGPTACDGGTATCDGTVVVACSDGYAIREDCAQDPSYKRCQAGACIETGNECTVATDQASCDGTSVSFCQDGTTVDVDCVTLGFTGCANGECTK